MHERKKDVILDQHYGTISAGRRDTVKRGPGGSRLPVCPVSCRSCSDANISQPYLNVLTLDLKKKRCRLERNPLRSKWTRGAKAL